MSTKIEWCTETWNPIIGCRKLSPGCDNCFALRMAKRLASIGIEGYENVVFGNYWSGKQYFNDVTILKPLSWRKPRMIFITSMGDIFHLSNNQWIDKVMAIVALSPMHTFLVLTKRSRCLHAYFDRPKDLLIQKWEDAIYEMGLCDKNDDPDAPACYLHNRLQDEWPMKNLWLGVTAENQDRADERVPFLLATPAARRFVSVEPMLGSVDLVNVYEPPRPAATPPAGGENTNLKQLGFIDWVICGGESGPGARPMHPDWVRFLQSECHCAGVPFFFKQWGEWLPSYNIGERLEEFKFKNLPREHVFEDGIHTYRVGKKAAGAHLDGKEYKEYPKS